MTIHEGETLVLLGTSGSGKSTTLKMINRLIDPDEGTISLFGQNIQELDLIELRRKIGYAVQEIGLFPHMTVEENIGILLQLIGWSEKEIRERVDHLLTIFQMDPEKVRSRYPSELSGGQKQRVGVARALSADPPLLLMDEPFGALDPITREQAQKEFLELESKIKKTVLFVTHDLYEAVAMGDRIGLMDQGELLQIASPREFIENPPSLFADEFLGQHRFQLSLLTRPVKGFVEASVEEGEAEEKLQMSSTLFDALNLFKQSARPSLPVFSGEKFEGEIKKARLLEEISDLLMEEGPRVD